MKFDNSSLPPSQSRGKKKITPPQPPVKPALSEDRIEYLEKEREILIRMEASMAANLASVRSRIDRINRELNGDPEIVPVTLREVKSGFFVVERDRQ